MTSADLWNLTRRGQLAPPTSGERLDVRRSVVIADALWTPGVLAAARRFECWGMLCRTRLGWQP